MENLVCSGVLEILLSRNSVDRVRCELREPKEGVAGSYYHKVSLCLTKRNKESYWSYLTCITTFYLQLNTHTCMLGKVGGKDLYWVKKRQKGIMKQLKSRK